jgi:hypothetical protein
MINYYQSFLLPFLKKSTYILPNHIKQYYYFSWEDGLWDVLKKKHIPKLSTILIPDFYCIDVVENIRKHGYNVVFYPLDPYLQIQTKTFIQILKKENPSVIILFHACGVTNLLIKNVSWILYTQKHTIFIEDCVHRLVNPEDISLFHPNHIIMDSLRKDSPLRGSFLYGYKEFLNFPQTTHMIDLYTVSSSFYYLLFRLCLEISAIVPLPRFTKYAHEVLLKKHDDIIGDSPISHRGLPFIPFIHRHLNFKKIEKNKQKQVKTYHHLFQKLFNCYPELTQMCHPEFISESASVSGSQTDTNSHLSFYLFPLLFSDYKHLHVYPLGVRASIEQQKKLLNYLHKKGIIVWLKFPDCPWSQRQQVLFLPLGFHIKETDITYIYDVLNDMLDINKKSLLSEALI